MAVAVRGALLIATCVGAHALFGLAGATLAALLIAALYLHWHEWHRGT